MNYYEPEASETAPLPHRAVHAEPSAMQSRRGVRLLIKALAILLPLLLILATIAFFAGRHWVRQAMRDNLPQLDGTLSIAGLAAPVTIQRDPQGVPHIHAASLDDLVMAQGFVTAQDRLWQMDALRRHAAGELAEVLGPAMIPHDRTQRTLQIRAAADRALTTLDPSQLHWLELYARGVNASIDTQRPHLPLEFRILRYEPAPWTPRDSILVGLAMFQDLTNSFPQKLNREALTAKLPPALIADLYPVGSWRDHPPTQPTIDLTAPQENIPDIPLDESQTKLSIPDSPANPTITTNAGAPSSPRFLRLRWVFAPRANRTPLPSHQTTGHTETASTEDLLALQQTLKNPICEGCTAGSNNWTVSGAHTATGKPLLSIDMHLSHNVPGIWYEADLQSPSTTGAEFHVAGVSLPGVPFIVVGHNAHIAWGFTNLGAQVQDVYIEHTRGAGDSAEFQSPDGTWHPVLHQKETIHIRGGKDLILDVPATRHGTAATPIISGIFPTEKRTLSLRWTIYDPANLTTSFFTANSATDWPTLTAAFSSFGGPAQNLVYADDQGHIGYHAVGKIPLRGSLIQPTAISPVP